MNPSDQALSFFKEGYNCSQSVFAAFATRFGLDRDQALKIASGFGGGIGRTQKTCGAVTGAVMAVGLCEGHTLPDDSEKKEQTYSLTQQLINRFEKKHGTTECSVLLGHSLTTDEGRARIKELNLSETVCANCVLSAAQILEEMLGF